MVLPPEISAAAAERQLTHGSSGHSTKECAICEATCLKSSGVCYLPVI
jgi:hypothetical protein